MARALLSVSDKTGLAEFGRALVDRGFELVSTGGTARALRAAGLPVLDVSRGDRVPRDAGRTGEDAASRPSTAASWRAASRPDDLEAIDRHGIRPIDLVVVNLYPFVRTAARADVAVRRPGRGDRHRRAEPGPGGGQELPRRARRRVARRTTAAVIEQLDQPGRAVGGVPVLAGAQGVRAHGRVRRGHRDRARARPVLGWRVRADAGAAGAARAAASCPPPRRATFATARTRTRPAAWYRTRRQRPVRRPAGEGAVVHQPARHRLGRPHRAASSTSRRPSSSSTRTRAAPPPARRWPRPTSGRATPTRCRPSAASSASTGRWTSETARAIASTFIEAVIAPGIDDEALAVLSAKKNLRVVVADLARAFGRRAATVRRAIDLRRPAGAGPRRRRGGVDAVAAADAGAAGLARRHQAAADARRVAQRCASRGACAPT